MVKSKLTKKQFIAILIFLSGYAGFVHLYDDEMQQELWEDYNNE